MMFKETRYRLERRDYMRPEWKDNHSELYANRADAELAMDKQKLSFYDYIDGELDYQFEEEVIEHLQKTKDSTEWRVVEEVRDCKYASEHGWSDVYAYELVKVISDQTLEVRKMRTERDASDLIWEPGGFSARCVNPRDQKTTYFSEPDNPVIRIRKKKGDWNVWTHKGRTFDLRTEPYAYHDYNF